MRTLNTLRPGGFNGATACVIGVLLAPGLTHVRAGELESLIGCIRVPPCDRLSAPEADAAFQLARELSRVTALEPRGEGKFVDPAGETVGINDFRVLWYHQGDTAEPCGAIQDPKTIAALRDYVAAGHGLFLSGAALSLVYHLDVEPVSPRIGAPGSDHYTASFVSLDRNHPIFRGLAYQGDAVALTNAGYPAFADFHATGGPRGGMLLAGTPGGSENPLVEYELGKGRIIALGWRLPHYGNASNPHRINLQRLTGNILAYLGDALLWQPVVVRPVPEVVFAPKEPGVPENDWRALRMAIADLAATFSDRYPSGAAFLTRLDALKKSQDKLLAKGRPSDKEAQKVLKHVAEQFEQLRRDALLANPLLDFDQMLVVKRSEKQLGLPTNWQGNSCLLRTGYDNEIAVLSMSRGEGQLTTLFRPDDGAFVGDVELHHNADRLMFSMPAKGGPWRVFEMDLGQIVDLPVSAAGLKPAPRPRELPLIPDTDVNNYDACYLPNGNIIFCSTAPMVGVPCVTGSSHVGNLFLFEAATGNIRQLTFEQDHDWCPTVMNNGHVMYLRWEYSDLPHFVSRILFRMNPDGTEQMAYYGSNSYWPNAMFYARPVPNHPTKFVAVVGGHHDVPRMGELVLFDPSKGTHEADGAVQRIPGYGKKVEPVVLDGLVGGSWPKFLHPWPLSDKYFIVSAKPTSQSKWGIYLVDVFDNMVLLKETDGYALLEPVPVQERAKPPAIASRIEPDRKDATVYISDIYSGPGLAGVPHGAVKKLRLFTYHFAYHGVGGQVHRVGLDGPWDVKRVLGTVPVEPDGSAHFTIPANTPISIQPLDAEGKALQLMRSWYTAMPGEKVSCTGCHDRDNKSPSLYPPLALAKLPDGITPWYGPTRGFSFAREVQPVLDRFCVGCHDGRIGTSGDPLLDLRNARAVYPGGTDPNYNNRTKFTPSYLALKSFVRGPTIESDMHLLTPGEFHADTTKLVQLLRKGHHGVQLDDEAWDRLITWIDLNTPAHGTWHDIVGEDYIARQRERRRDTMKRFANRDEDPEAIFAANVAKIEPTIPQTVIGAPTAKVSCSDWPFDRDEARRRQQAAGESKRSISIGDGIELQLVHIPAGRFVMGDPEGLPDEQSLTIVQIEKPFWIGQFEVTNEQYNQFDPRHDSGLEEGDFLQFSEEERGYRVNAARQPVARVSWHEAIQFCDWISTKTGLRFSLPTEAQWEYACRAGTNSPLAYGRVKDNFSKLANLADASLRKVDLFGWGLPVGAIPPWRPADSHVNDGFRVSAPVGSFAANPWGLFDMHGNVAEWTRACDVPNSYSDTDGRNGAASAVRRVVRGGSWDDRPHRARSSFRLSYWPHQKVYDVGFRVVCDGGLESNAAGQN